MNKDMYLEKLYAMLEELSGTLAADDELTDFGKAEIEKAIAQVRDYVDSVLSRKGE